MSRKLDFKISSGLKNIIGRELITDDYIAIFELVKNSYDAASKEVDIIFENLKIDETDNVVNEDVVNEDARILIIDRGDGMSFRNLEDKWLFVGYSDKKYKSDKNFRDKIKNKKRLFSLQIGFLGVFCVLYQYPQIFQPCQGFCLGLLIHYLVYRKFLPTDSFSESNILAGS